jgi:hypothetical protein
MPTLGSPAPSHPARAKVDGKAPAEPAAESVAPSDGAIALVFIFMVPVLLVSTGVGIVGLVDKWWALALLLAVDAICTAVVLWASFNYASRDR